MLTHKRFGRSAALLAAALMLAAGGSAADEMETIKLVERAASDVVTDLAPSGDSPGDILTFANDIYDDANATKIGDNNGWCIRTAAGKAWECTWTTRLEKGQITVEGPFYDGQDSVLAVTGGTGAYAGAGGQMKLHARDDKGTEYDFVFELTR